MVTPASTRGRIMARVAPAALGPGPGGAAHAVPDALGPGFPCGRTCGEGAPAIRGHQQSLPRAQVGRAAPPRPYPRGCHHERHAPRRRAGQLGPAHAPDERVPEKVLARTRRAVAARKAARRRKRATPAGIDMEQLEITSEQSFKTHNDLPLARIKRIMKSDEDVRMISVRPRRRRRCRPSRATYRRARRRRRPCSSPRPASSSSSN